MRHTWRWFGPVDKVTVRDAAQAGAEGIVSALHHVPTGTAWTIDEIRKRQDEIAAGGLVWDVVDRISVGKRAVPHRIPGAPPAARNDIVAVVVGLLVYLVLLLWAHAWLAGVPLLA